MADATEDPAPALIERIDGGRVRIAPRHPEWDDDPRRFSELYSLVREVSIPCSGPTPKRDVIGSRDPDARRCAFCGRSPAEVSFKKEAHTVPAAFGNRHLFTYEECDPCNESFGNELDQHFTNYLASERIVAGCRKRGGSSIKLKAADGTFFAYDHEEGGLQVVVDTDRKDSHTAYTIRPPASGSDLSEIDVRFQEPACSIDHVMREIVRLTWMFLSPAQRLESPEFLALILGHQTPKAWELFRTFAPGAPGLVELRVWRRIQGTDTPSTVTAFTVGATMILWASCDGQSLTYRPGPLPAFEADPAYGDPTFQQLKFELGEFRGTRLNTLTLGALNVQTDLPDTATAASPPALAARGVRAARPTADVEFRWLKEEAQRTLRAKLDVQRNDAEHLRIEFSGADLIARFAVHRRIAANTTTCNLDMSLAHAPSDKALATVELFEALADPDRGATVFLEDTQYCDFSGFQLALEIDFEALRRQLAEIVSVQAALDCPLTVPDDDDRDSWMTARILAAAIRGAPVKVKPFPFTFRANQVSEVEKMLAENSETLTLSIERNWIVDGTELDPGNVRIAISRPFVASRVELPTGEIRLLLSNESYRFEFERWPLST